MRLGTSRFGRSVGRILRRAVGRERPRVSWEMDRGPVFGNCLGEISFEGRSAHLLVQQARLYDEDAGPDFETVIEFDLVAGSRSMEQAEAT